MKYFGRNYKRQTIEVDTDSVSAEDPELVKRLDRIEQNYSRLDQVLSDLESRIELDDRLSTANEEAATDTSKRVRKKKPR